MKNRSSFVKWGIFPLFVSLLLTFFYLHFFENRAVVELDIDVAKRTWFSIFWAAEGKGYSPWHRARVRLSPDRHHYRFFLTDLRRVQRLRIDPHMYRGVVVLRKLIIQQNGFLPLRFETPADFARLVPLFQIQNIETGEEGIRIRSAGNDPQLELTVELQRSGSQIAPVIARISCIFVLVWLFFLATEGKREEAWFVPLLLAGVLGCVLVMAGLTRENVHPDEYVHFEAARYYQTKWLPPAVDDPAIRHTYSVYGVSRLNNRETAYFFAGKLARLLEPFRLPEYFSLRLLNITLFACILLYLLQNRYACLMAVPLLLSPQIWYVFSYCNSDAFGVFLAFLVACQLVIPTSLLNRFLGGGLRRGRVLTLLFLGFCCGLLFLLKKNYYFFILFLAGYVIWYLVFVVTAPEQRKRYCIRLLGVIALGLVLAGARTGTDYLVSGTDRNVKLATLREELAKPLYKPSTPLHKKHPNLYRKARGESLTDMIVKHRWFEKTFRSAFGMYGYFTVSATDAYYNTVRWVGTAFFLFILVSVFVRGGVQGNILMLYGIGCAAALIAASLYHSWTADFQAQGRYIFPVFPMCSLVLYHLRHSFNHAVFRLLLVAMFILSMYSFIFVGLMYLPKVS